MTDEQLDREFAYIPWENSCRDPYGIDQCCRRATGHDGEHASGYGAGRKRWTE